MVYKYNFDKIQPGAHKLISNSEYKDRFDILVELLYKYDVKFKDETLRPKQAIQTLITSTPPLSEEQQKIIYRGLSLLLHSDKFTSDILSAERFNKETSEFLFKKIEDLLQDKKLLAILRNSLNILREKGESSIANTSTNSERTQRPPQTRPTNIPHN